MPTSNTEQIAAVQAASLDIWVGLTNKTLDGFERLVKLNLQTMKSTLANAQENVRKACAAKDAAELLTLQAGLWQPAIEQAQAYRQQLADIAAATRADFAKVAEAQYEASKCKMQEVIENATKEAPPGSEAAVAAWQSALSATTTLCETMQQAAKQATEIAESNWNMAAAAASNAAQQAANQAARAAKR
jgi:phasin family protein